jgi:hypothetical protein
MSHTQQDTVHRFNQYAHALPQVKRYLAQLEQQDLWWTTVAMVGKINKDNIDPQLLVSVVDTQKAFQALRDQMMEALINRYLNQAHSEIKLKAQASIDILNRNLFERTADVGFLAADDDLVQFMAQQPAACDAQKLSALSHIEARLQEYVAKYSVYDDIALLSPNGEVLAQLSRAGRQDYAKPCHESWQAQALQGHTPYTEVYAQSNLFGAQPSLFYAKRVQHRVGDQWQTVGVLCLRFKFEQEMNTIFNTLNRAGHESDVQPNDCNHPAFEFSLLDAKGQVLAGKSASSLARVATEPVVSCDVAQNAQGELEYFARATGYEGFMGLDWFSRVAISQQAAFVQGTALDSLEGCIEPTSILYLRDLEETNQHVSVLLLIVILNGKMTSLKKDAKAFLPVLDSFQDISRAIELIFNDFIGHIHQVMLKTIHDKVRFSASLAAELMDRNLYERANDCRWWALNNRFRTLLTQHDLSTYSSSSPGQPLSVAQTQELSAILSEINALYTVYSQLVIYDRNGVILAVSQAGENDTDGLIGTVFAPLADVKRTLNLSHSQQYVVSKFEQSAYYQNRSTYIYHAAIGSTECVAGSVKNVGGVAIVFDSEPQFKAMLDDTQPSYMVQAIQQASFSVLATEDGVVVASNNAQFVPGDSMLLPALGEFVAGKSGSLAWRLPHASGRAIDSQTDNQIDKQIDNQNYVVGYHMSHGYREYKQTDGYVNNVVAWVFTPI